MRRHARWTHPPKRAGTSRPDAKRHRLERHGIRRLHRALTFEERSEDAMRGLGAVTRRSVVTGLCAWPVVPTRPARAQDRVRLAFAAAGEGSAFLAFAQAAKSVIERHAPVALDVRRTGGS